MLMVSGVVFCFLWSFICVKWRCLVCVNLVIRPSFWGTFREAEVAMNQYMLSVVHASLLGVEGTPAYVFLALSKHWFSQTKSLWDILTFLHTAWLYGLTLVLKILILTFLVNIQGILTLEVCSQPGKVEHTYNSSFWEAETRGLL